MARSLKRKIAICIVVIAVALVILKVLGVLWVEFTDFPGITCVSNPINEIVTKIQTAQNGIDLPTGAICMKSGEKLPPNAIANQLNNLDSVKFDCFEGSAVCSGANPPVTFPSSDSIAASGDVKFKGIVHCDRKESGKYDCTISIQSA